MKLNLKGNKKIFLGLGLLSLCILLGGGFLVFRSLQGSPAETVAVPTPKPRLSLPVNQLPLDQRPYITLVPTASREVVVSIENMPVKAESVDYELQYSNGTREEAAIGELLLAKLPATQRILLGSQSGGGKISYHEEVTGGVVALTFYGENYRISNDWTYISNSPASRMFTSRDGSFEVEFDRPYGGRYVILFQNPGFPELPQGELNSGMYTFSGTAPLSGVTGTVRYLPSETESELKLWAWNDSQWQLLDSTLGADGYLVYEGELFESYVATTE